MDLSHVAGYLFVLGLIVAVIAGAAVGLSNPIGATATAWISVIFMIIGVVIGACMSTSKKLEEEVYVLVLVSLVLLVASSMNVFAGLNTATGATATGPGLGTAIDDIVGYIAMFSAAAMIVLAIRTLTHFHVSKIR
jgi:hypothetical protein